MKKAKVFVPAILIIVLLAVVAVPSFLKARKQSQRNACANNLTIIASGIESWVLAANKSLGDDVDISAISQYMRRATLPVCPAGGSYDIPPVGKRPTCTVHGDLLRENGWTWSKWPEEMRSNNDLQLTK